MTIIFLWRPGTGLRSTEQSSAVHGSRLETPNSWNWLFVQIILNIFQDVTNFQNWMKGKRAGYPWIREKTWHPVDFSPNIDKSQLCPWFFQAISSLLGAYSDSEDEEEEQVQLWSWDKDLAASENPSYSNHGWLVNMGIPIFRLRMLIPSVFFIPPNLNEVVVLKLLKW